MHESRTVTNESHTIDHIADLIIIVKHDVFHVMTHGRNNGFIEFERSLLVATNSAAIVSSVCVAATITETEHSRYSANGNKIIEK